MKNFSRILYSTVILFLGLSLYGQQVTDLRINEILIKNDTNYVDEYGRRVPWLEIYNTAYNSVNISECYITDDTTGLADGTGKAHWYHIPKGDPKTLIDQRSTIVFYLDGTPLYGTFHVNFDPSNSRTNYIALISSNGKTLIDLMEYPVELRDTNLSYGCFDDGLAYKDDNGKKVANVGYMEHFTPGSTNNIVVGRTKAEVLLQDDPYGIGLAIISMSVVFSALILIFCMLKIFGKVSKAKSRKAAEATAQTAAAADTAALVVEEEEQESITGEEVAAISMALHLYFNGMHDEESEVITIVNPSAHYSPWSQKELTMKRVQRKF